MLITYKSITLFGAVILTGLSAGLFYAWSVSVIPGTLKLSDITYLKSMQAINKAILNPGFFLIFFGSIICLSLATISEFHDNQAKFSLLLLSAAIYFIGTLGVTAFGNVPLNNQLEVLNLDGIGIDEAANFRQFYERKWNRLHLIRTVFSVMSFSLTVIILFLQVRKP